MRTLAIPAKAGTQPLIERAISCSRWVPAFAGMTGK